MLLLLLQVRPKDKIGISPGPMAKPAYTISFHEELEMRTQIADLLARGSVQASRSLYAAPVLFIKVTTKIRMWCDYQMLNSKQ